MIFVFLGPPGAGKGTQADLISKRLKCKKISTGDVLRENIRNKTPLGVRVSEIIAKGFLVDDDTMVSLLKHELNANVMKYSCFILDGFPRTVKQAELLDGISSAGVKKVLHIDVPEDAVVKRLGGRQTCPGCGRSFHEEFNKPRISGKCDGCAEVLVKRADDEEANIRTRMGVYAKQTSPLIEYYKARGNYLWVDGNKGQEEVLAELVEQIESSINKSDE